MISLEELRIAARHQGVAPEVLEKDYCLGWFISGIAESALGDALILKGGTALRKGYFPDYRFSEDLDYTTKRVWTGEELKAALEQACRLGTRMSGIAFSLVSLDPVRTDPNTPAWNARVSFVGPRAQAREARRIRLDITAFEEILLEPEFRQVFHPYSDVLDKPALFYQLEEILAEKLRTILQRGYPRDVYDVWYMLQNAGDRFDEEIVRDIFIRKCAYKGVIFNAVDQFFDILKAKNTEIHWQRSLGMQIRSLPEFQSVCQELRASLNALLR